MAQHIAKDLYNFLSSFVKDSSVPGTMNVPNSAFDAWLERFERKSKRDPVFFLKPA